MNERFWLNNKINYGIFIIKKWKKNRIKTFVEDPELVVTELLLEAELYFELLLIRSSSLSLSSSSLRCFSISCARIALISFWTLYLSCWRASAFYSDKKKILVQNNIELKFGSISPYLLSHLVKRFVRRVHRCTWHLTFAPCSSSSRSRSCCRSRVTVRIGRTHLKNFDSNCLKLFAIEYLKLIVLVFDRFDKYEYDYQYFQLNIHSVRLDLVEMNISEKGNKNRTISNLKQS